MMSEDEARELVAAVTQGRTLEVKWEGGDAYCFLVVRHEPERGLVSRHDEIPFDVLSPWRETSEAEWSEAELVAFLKGIRTGTAELAG